MSRSKINNLLYSMLESSQQAKATARRNIGLEIGPDDYGIAHWDGSDLVFIEGYHRYRKLSGTTDIDTMSPESLNFVNDATKKDFLFPTEHGITAMSNNTNSLYPEKNEHTVMRASTTSMIMGSNVWLRNPSVDVYGPWRVINDAPLIPADPSEGTAVVNGSIYDDELYGSAFRKLVRERDDGTRLTMSLGGDRMWGNLCLSCQGTHHNSFTVLAPYSYSHKSSYIVVSANSVSTLPSVSGTLVTEDYIPGYNGELRELIDSKTVSHTNYTNRCVSFNKLVTQLASFQQAFRVTDTWSINLIYDPLNCSIEFNLLTAAGVKIPIEHSVSRITASYIWFDNAVQYPYDKTTGLLHNWEDADGIHQPATANQFGVHANSYTLGEFAWPSDVASFGKIQNFDGKMDFNHAGVDYAMEFYLSKRYETSSSNRQRYNMTAFIHTAK